MKFITPQKECFSSFFLKGFEVLLLKIFHPNDVICN